MEPLLMRFLIAVLAYFLLEKIVEIFTSPDSKARELFTVILLIACALFAIFGSVLFK